MLQWSVRVKVILRPLPPPSFMWRYCSFLARAAGGAVRPGSPAAPPPLQGCHLFSPPLSSPLYHSPPHVSAEPLQHPPTVAQPLCFDGGEAGAGGLPATGREGHGKYPENDWSCPVETIWWVAAEHRDAECNHPAASVQLIWFEVPGSVAWCLPRGHLCERY